MERLEPMLICIESKGVAVKIAVDDTHVWVIHSIEQWLELEKTEGDFRPIGTIALPPKSTELVAHIRGIPAGVLAVAIMEVGKQTRGQTVAVPEFIGIASGNWRWNGGRCAVICRHSDRRLFLAVVFSVEQLRQLANTHFPDWIQDIMPIQAKTQLPETSIEPVFVVTGLVAAGFIFGCVATRQLEIYFE